MSSAVAFSPGPVIGDRAAPFPLPPGLEAASELRAAGFDSASKALDQFGLDTDRQVTVEAIRDAVLHDVDVRMQEKADELWQRAKRVMGQLQKRSKEETGQQGGNR